MKITTQEILKVLYIFSWIIFVGVCIEAGGFIFNTFFTLVVNPVDAKHFWEGLDLSSLYQHDPGFFFGDNLDDVHRGGDEGLVILLDRKDPAR